MSTRRNALGRGIDALLPSAPALGALESPPGSQPPGPDIRVDAIDPNPEQPRRQFPSEELEQLADSIRRHGMLQPVVVRRAGERYELLVGERRWRAARAAGLQEVPAVVADVDPAARLEFALVENVQRRDLNPIELAYAFRALAESGATQEEIAERVSLSRPTIANHLRLLELPRELQEDVERGELTMGHAKALLQVTHPERRRYLRDRIVRDGLSVRAAEEFARSAPEVRRSRPKASPAAHDPNLQRLVDSLRQRFQTRVRLAGDASRGRIEIEYFNEADLQRLAALLLGDA